MAVPRVSTFTESEYVGLEGHWVPSNTCDSGALSVGSQVTIYNGFTGGSLSGVPADVVQECVRGLVQCGVLHPKHGGDPGVGHPGLLAPQRHLLSVTFRLEVNR